MSAVRRVLSAGKVVFLGADAAESLARWQSSDTRERSR